MERTTATLHPWAPACGPDPVLQTSGESPTTSLISTFPKSAVQEKSRDGQGLSQSAISFPWANRGNLPETIAQGQRPALPHLGGRRVPLPLCGLTPLRGPQGSCAHNAVAAPGRLGCSGHPEPSARRPESAASRPWSVPHCSPNPQTPSRARSGRGWRLPSRPTCLLPLQVLAGKGGLGPGRHCRAWAPLPPLLAPHHRDPGWGMEAGVSAHRATIVTLLRRARTLPSVCHRRWRGRRHLCFCKPRGVEWVALEKRLATSGSWAFQMAFGCV